jgi:hypothetical protein
MELRDAIVYQGIDTSRGCRVEVELQSRDLEKYEVAWEALAGIEDVNMPKSKDCEGNLPTIRVYFLRHRHSCPHGSELAAKKALDDAGLLVELNRNLFGGRK